MLAREKKRREKKEKDENHCHPPGERMKVLHDLKRERNGGPFKKREESGREKEVVYTQSWSEKRRVWREKRGAPPHPPNWVGSVESHA